MMIKTASSIYFDLTTSLVLVKVRTSLLALAGQESCTVLQKIIHTNITISIQTLNFVLACTNTIIYRLKSTLAMYKCIPQVGFRVQNLLQQEFLSLNTVYRYLQNMVCSCRWSTATDFLQICYWQQVGLVSYCIPVRKCVAPVVLEIQPRIKSRDRHTRRFSVMCALGRLEYPQPLLVAAETQACQPPVQ